MNSEDNFAILCLLLVGAFYISFGIYRLFGPVNVSYIYRDLLRTSALYNAIPGGCSMLLLGLGFFLTGPIQTFVLFLSLFIGFVGTIMMTFPKFRPAWLQWLYQEHSSILNVLRQEIRHEGLPVWNNRINTQEELQAWVEEVRARRGI